MQPPVAQMQAVTDIQRCPLGKSYWIMKEIIEILVQKFQKIILNQSFFPGVGFGNLIAGILIKTRNGSLIQRILYFRAISSQMRFSGINLTLSSSGNGYAFNTAVR